MKLNLIHSFVTSLTSCLNVQTAAIITVTPGVKCVFSALTGCCNLVVQAQTAQLELDNIVVN